MRRCVSLLVIFLLIMPFIGVVSAQEQPGVPSERGVRVEVISAGRSEPISDLSGQEMQETFETRRENGKDILVTDRPRVFVYSGGDANGPPIATLGHSSEEATLPIDIQLGTRSGNGVYLRVFTTRESASSVVEEILEEVEPKSSVLSEAGYVPQRCTGERICVMRCPDGKGGEYCCQYDCSNY